MTTILAIEGGGSGYRAVRVEDQQIEIIGRMAPDGPVIDILVAWINECAMRINAQAIGISTSGFVTEDGTISHSTNIGLPDDFPLARLVAETTGLPTRAVNDLVAATRGASTVFPDLPVFLMVNVGGGVGQRKFDRGRINPFDERGHMILDLSPDAPLCSCGLHGCAESFLGGNNLTRCVKLAPVIVPDGLHPCKFLDQEFLAQTGWAKNIYWKFSSKLGVYLANLQLHDNVSDIVFRGTTVTKALRLPGVESWVRGSLQYYLPDKKLAEVKFHFLPERPELPNDWDAYLGAAAIAYDALAAK